jgi:threonine dehydratase
MNELMPASIVAAAQLLKGRVLRTPLELSGALTEASGVKAYLKLENLQRTDSHGTGAGFSCRWHRREHRARFTYV